MWGLLGLEIDRVTDRRCCFRGTSSRIVLISGSGEGRHDTVGLCHSVSGDRDTFPLQRFTFFSGVIAGEQPLLSLGVKRSITKTYNESKPTSVLPIVLYGFIFIRPESLTRRETSYSDEIHNRKIKIDRWGGGIVEILNPERWPYFWS